MNKDRRKAISALVEDIAKIAGQVDDFRSGVESVRDDEQEAFDNLPESLQEGDRGQVSQEAIDALEEALFTLEDIDFDAITSALDTAAA